MKSLTVSLSNLVIFLSLLFLISFCTKEPGKKDKLKVKAVFATPIEEPWDGAIHKALEKAEKEYSINYDYIDNVQPSMFEKELTTIAENNYDLIIGDAFSAEEIVRRVARNYPKIKFVFGSSLGPSEPNLSVFDNWIHEPAYLAGMIAGKITKTNVIGVVGGFSIPEVNRLINAFKEGAKETNHEIKVKIAFIGSWFDPPKAKQASQILMSQGVDVMYAERDGVIEACAEKKIPVFGNIIDQHKRSPEYVVTSVLWDMWPTVKRVIEQIESSTYSADNYAEWSMMVKGGAKLAPFYEWENKLSEPTKALVHQREDEIITGRFRVPVIESVPISD